MIEVCKALANIIGYFYVLCITGGTLYLCIAYHGYNLERIVVAGNETYHVCTAVCAIVANKHVVKLGVAADVATFYIYCIIGGSLV